MGNFYSIRIQFFSTVSIQQYPALYMKTINIDHLFIQSPIYITDTANGLANLEP